MLKYVWNWFVKSSANPKELSLTLKAGIPLIAFLGLGDYLSANDAETLIDAMVGAMVALGTFMTFVLTAWGIIRKVFLSVRLALKK